MRYRRDIPLVSLEHDPGLFNRTADHIAAHLTGAAHPDDDDKGGPGSPLITLYRHDHSDDPSLIVLVGETTAEARAPYFQLDYDPAADHPEIVFRPYREAT